jgi:hypothetical protein
MRHAPATTTDSCISRHDNKVSLTLSEIFKPHWIQSRLLVVSAKMLDLIAIESCEDR